MDDYTWKKTLQARQKRVRRERFFVLVLIAAVIGSSIWYFLCYTRTPAYAVKELQQAMERRDAKMFQNYVDLESVTSAAYDDLTSDLFKYDASITPQTRALFENFYVLIKPQLTAGFQQTILQYISTDAWELPDGTNILKGRQLGIDYETLLARSLIRRTHLQEVGTPREKGSHASLDVTVLQEDTQTPFHLELIMEKKESGWKIIQIKNYRAYLDAIAPLIHQDISSYIASTKDITEKYNYAFENHQYNFQRMSASSDGRLSESQRKKIASFLENETIPLLQQRQRELDEIQAPAGAAYLARLRQDSTDLSIRAWRHYINGLRMQNIFEMETAESLHKQELATEQRIDEIIRYAAMTKSVPNLP